MRRKIFFLSILCCAIFFSSCASISTSASYPLIVDSEPSGANVTIMNKEGKEVYSGKTPASVRLKASEKYMSGERYTVRVSKTGYENQVSYINTKIDGWYWGNILFGGLIGMLIVDPLTGAMFKIDTKSLNVILEEGDSDVVQKENK